jgi:hypothetical protein
MLILADTDKNVDSYETERVYISVVDSSMLSIKWIKDTGHGLLKTQYMKKDFMTTITYLISPRSLYIDEYLNATKEFLAQR